MIKHVQATALVLAAGVVSIGFTGCGGNGGPRATPSGNAFVNSVVSQTSETAEPKPINDIDLTFSEDPAAFDALFQ